MDQHELEDELMPMYGGTISCQWMVCIGMTGWSTQSFGKVNGPEGEVRTNNWRHKNQEPLTRSLSSAAYDTCRISLSSPNPVALSSCVIQMPIPREGQGLPLWIANKGFQLFPGSFSLDPCRWQETLPEYCGSVAGLQH